MFSAVPQQTDCDNNKIMHPVGQRKYIQMVFQQNDLPLKLCVFIELKKSTIFVLWIWMDEEYEREKKKSFE